MMINKAWFSHQLSPAERNFDIKDKITKKKFWKMYSLLKRYYEKDRKMYLKKHKQIHDKIFFLSLKFYQSKGSEKN